MAGTFQDRLVTELRLAGARTIDQANAVLRDFLPRYNARFAVPAELPEPAYRTWDSQRVLSEILCFKHTRKVARDNTVRYNWRTLRLLPAPSVPAMPECMSKSWNTPTAASRYAIRTKSSPAGRRRRDPVCCEPLTGPWLPPLNSTAS